MFTKWPFNKKLCTFAVWINRMGSAPERGGDQPYWIVADPARLWGICNSPKSKQNISSNFSYVTSITVVPYTSQFSYVLFLLVRSLNKGVCLYVRSYVQQRCRTRKQADKQALVMQQPHHRSYFKHWLPVLDRYNPTIPAQSASKSTQHHTVPNDIVYAPTLQINRTENCNNSVCTLQILINLREGRVALPVHKSTCTCTL